MYLILPTLTFIFSLDALYLILLCKELDVIPYPMGVYNFFN
jgi:hypothetical protein